MTPQRTPAVISRPELPVIERHPRTTRRAMVLLLGVALLGGAFWAARQSGPHDEQAFAVRHFTISEVDVQPRSRADQTVWTVSGKLINRSKRTSSAPDLKIELVRQDDSVAVQSVIDLRQQIVPGQAAIPFSSQLTTAAGEALSARVTAVKAGSDER